MKLYLLIILAFFICSLTNAQEYLSGLAENPILISQPASKSTVKLDTIKIPFLDDFSRNTIFPNSKLWQDKDAFIDYTDTSYQISVGVATLDAWDSRGHVYDFATTFPFIADHLTSLPLDLSTDINNNPITIADSLYFSFYYQPGGGIGDNPLQIIGNAPEQDDSLVLEFSTNPPNTTIVAADTFYIYLDSITINQDTIFTRLDSLRQIGDTIYIPFDTTYVIADTTITQQWQRVWASEGMTLKKMHDNFNTYFRQIIIPIKDSKFLYKGFQFRFMNYASLYDDDQIGWKAGNIDQWHLDYVYLNKNRTEIDTTYEDIVFTHPQPSMLKIYTAIPWPHYTNTLSSDNNVNDIVKMHLKYLGKNTVASTNVNFLVQDMAHIMPDYMLFETSGRTYNISNNEQAFSDPCSFDFKSSSDKDSAEFKITSISNNSLPFNTQNDTVVYYQNFYNYYAYDDGVPDNGYGINATNAWVACKFTSIKEDTLQAVQIFFNHTLNGENAFPFKLCIWEDNNGFPGNLKYSQDAVVPIFEDSINQFHTYRITGTKFLLNNSYFIGWEQEKNIYLNIGFDKSQNRQMDIFYKIGKDISNTMYAGTLMIRPVFGKEIPLGINNNSVETTKAILSIYPNPVSAILHINPDQDINSFNFELFNTNGSKVLYGQLKKSIDMQNLPEGLYLLKVINSVGTPSMFKIIHTTR